MPEDVEQQSATEEQKLQAEQTIENDPTIPAPDPEPEPSRYEGMTLAELRTELKDRQLPTSGNKDELADRLVAADVEANKPPVEDAVAAQSVNGGITKDVAFSVAHADTLQELSDARRASQLKAAKG